MVSNGGMLISAIWAHSRPVVTAPYDCLAPIYIDDLLKIFVFFTIKKLFKIIDSAGKWAFGG
jgi:hypothetical protein